MNVQELPPPPKRGEGFLGKGQKQEMPDFSGLTSDVNTLARRLRMLEEGSTNLRRFFQIIEENMISKHKHFAVEIKTINSDIMEIRKEVQELRDKLGLVIKELQFVARKEDVKVLEKYLNLWNPIKFVTQNEVEEIIHEVIDKKNGPG